MTRDEVVKAIRETAAGNRLTCSQAHDLARTLNVPMSLIGKTCNEMNIKISACQLGCF